MRQRLLIGSDYPLHIGGAFTAVIDGRVGVKTCDRSCGLGQKGLGQCTPCRHFIKKGFLIEPGHFDNSIDERAGSVEGLSGRSPRG